MPTSQPSAPQPARVLGGLDATCVVVGAIIGTGIFFNPSGVAKLVDSPGLALLAWAIGGMIALCGALVFAELGGSYRANGAQYEVIRDAWGPLPAFLFVFCNATGTQAGAIGIISLVCTRHLAAAAGTELTGAGPLLGVASLLIVLIAMANIVGVRWGSRIQNLTVYTKVLTLLAITLMAVLVGRPAHEAAAAAAPLTGGLGAVEGVIAALVPTSFAYGGWQQALWISGEVRRPRRSLPRAIIGGVLLVIGVYLLANWAYLHLLGFEGVRESKALAADAVATQFPGTGRRLIAAAVGVSAFGVLNSQLLGGPRLIYGMAHDGRFFAVFGRVSPRFGTPVAAILLLAIPALLLLFAAGENAISKILTGAVFIDGVFFILTGAAVFVFRWRMARGGSEAGVAGRVRAGTDDVDAESEGAPYRLPLYPLVPLLFILGVLGATIGTYLDATVRNAAYIGAAWIVVGAIVYYAWFRRKSGAIDGVNG
jgi:APA family basic amino acid/polyamine antiporter